MPKITKVGQAAGASTLAMATILSGLSFGPAAVAAPSGGSTTAGVSVSNPAQAPVGNNQPAGWRYAQKESNGTWLDCAPGSAMTGRQHGFDTRKDGGWDYDYDENAPSWLRCGAVSIGGLPAQVGRTVESPLQRGNGHDDTKLKSWRYECPTIDGHDSFITGRWHLGDSEADGFNKEGVAEGTKWKCSTLHVGGKYLKAVDANRWTTSTMSESGKWTWPEHDFPTIPAWNSARDRPAGTQFQRSEVESALMSGEYHHGDENGVTRYKYSTLTTETPIGPSDGLEHSAQTPVVTLPAKGSGARAVPIVTRAKTDFSEPAANVTLRAPEGTRFKAGQIRVGGQWSKDGSSWISYAGHDLTNIVISTDGRTMSGRFDGNMTLRAGEWNRWTPEVEATSDKAGGGAISYTVDGAASSGAIRLSASGSYELRWEGVAPPQISDGLEHIAQRGVAVPPKGRGAVDVPVVVRSKTTFSQPTSEVTLTAPSGTAFETGLTTIPGAWSADGLRWEPYGNHKLSNVRYSNNNRTITATWSEALSMASGSYNRWTPRVVSESTTAGSGQLTMSVRGSANNGAVTLNTTGSNPLTWEAAAQASAPSAPRNFEWSSNAETETTASWSAPASDGGAPITGYRVTVDGADKGTAPTLTKNLGKLDLSAEHNVEIRAINEAGASQPLRGTIGVRLAPTITRLAAQPNTKWVDIEWSNPDPSIVKSYDIIRDGEAIATGLAADQTLARFNDHEFGKTYEYRVRAHSTIGGSRTSEPKRVEVIELGTIAPLPVSETTLDRSRSTDVRMGIRAGAEVKGFSGNLISSAPIGTRFAVTAGETDLQGWVRDNADSEWRPLDEFTISGARVNDERTAIIATWNDKDDLALTPGAQVSWTIPIDVREGASPSTVSLATDGWVQTAGVKYNVSQAHRLVIPDEAVTPAPSAPAISSLAQIEESTSVRIDWTADTANADSFDVLRDGEVVKNVPSDTTSAQIDDHEYGTPYRYVVRAVGKGGEKDSESEKITLRKTVLEAAPMPEQKLDHDNSTKVRIGIQTTGDEVLRKFESRFTLSAPEGTTFTEGQQTLPGYFQPIGSDEWKPSSLISMTNIEISDDRRSMTGSVRHPAPTHSNEAWSWQPELVVDDAARAGIGELGFAMTADTNWGDQRVTGGTKVIIDEENRAPVIDSFSAGQVGQSDVMPRWSASDADGEVVGFTLVEKLDGEVIREQHLDGAETRYMFEGGHELGKTYTYELQATDNKGATSEWATDNVTIVDAEVPTLPGGTVIKGENATHQSIEAVWPSAKDNAGVTKYSLSVNGGDAIGLAHKDGDEQRYELTGLEPSREYSVKVTAFDQRGNESAAIYGVLTTAPDPSIPGTPEDVRVAFRNDLAEAAWQVSWGGKGTEFAKEWKFRIRNSVASQPGDQTIKAWSAPQRGDGKLINTDLLDKELQRGTTYWVDVKAVWDGGESAWSAPKEFTTGTKRR